MIYSEMTVLILMNTVAVAIPFLNSNHRIFKSNKTVNINVV